jgi:hypothetical protein
VVRVGLQIAALPVAAHLAGIAVTVRATLAASAATASLAARAVVFSAAVLAGPVAAPLFFGTVAIIAALTALPVAASLFAAAAAIASAAVIGVAVGVDTLAPALALLVRTDVYARVVVAYARAAVVCGIVGAGLSGGPAGALPHLDSLVLLLADTRAALLTLLALATDRQTGRAGGDLACSGRIWVGEPAAEGSANEQT